MGFLCAGYVRFPRNDGRVQRGNGWIDIEARLDVVVIEAVAETIKHVQLKVYKHEPNA